MFDCPRHSGLPGSPVGLVLFQFLTPRLFNVTSSFDENEYTTPLDEGSLTRDQRAHAARLAAEIEGKTSSNIHMREERNLVRFCLRGGRMCLTPSSA